jgi:mono/diheme cytochrome c family protein
MRRTLAVGAAAMASALCAAPVRAGSPAGLPPQTNYMLHCQGCHRPDGSGLPGEVPDLRGQVARFLGAPGGRAFLARVPGVANAPLSDADLAALLDWLLVRFDPAHLPADFAPYGADEVRELRARPLSKIGATRAALVAALSGSREAALPPPGSPRPGAAAGPARPSR